VLADDPNHWRFALGNTGEARWRVLLTARPLGQRIAWASGKILAFTARSLPSLRRRNVGNQHAEAAEQQNNSADP
jgi:hypothetical protein